jgi:hypothetical protein
VDPQPTSWTGTTNLGASALTSPFFCEALPNTFLENSFTREDLDERIHFLYYIGEAKKVAPSAP